MGKIDFINRIVEHASENSSKVAVVDHDGNRMTTYQELVDKAGQIAAYLQSLELPLHSYIVIQLPKSVEFLAAELGVWMSGHVIVPIGEHFPKSRVDYIVQHCKSPLIITVDVFQDAMQMEPLKTFVSIALEDEGALLYTSGSSGYPKGIVHTFKSLQQAVIAQSKAMGIQEDSLFGSGVPFYFIAFLFYYGILYADATIHIWSDEVMKDIHKLKEYIHIQQIDICFISPAILRNCKDMPLCIKRIITGSERLSGTTSSTFELLNCYGMTETGGPLTFFSVDKLYDNTPIGKPVPSVKISIRNTEGEILPPNTEGEICFEGSFAKCYLGEPEKTAELYRGGVLHTGDVGIELPDGNIQYVNRMDWMVKINGQRVEPGEVEAIIKKIPNIENAIVKGFTSDTESVYLCAYYIASGEIEENEIHHILEEQLPPYMIPSFFVAMESFPLNANGKLDRKSLLPPDRNSMRAAYAAPENEIQKQLCEAYAKILKMDKIGLDDDFFCLGGDSIRVVMLQQQCSNLSLSSKKIFAARTPRKLADMCQKQTDVRLEKKEAYPLSQTQMGIYVECMNRRGEAAYNNPRLYKLGASVDLQQVQQAVEATVAAHPYVMTRISLGAENEPLQHRMDDAVFHIEIENISEAELLALKPELVQPFDLLNDQLFCIRLFRTESASYLFFDFHHIIFDGTSFAVMAQDFNRAYVGEAVERETFSGFEVAQEEESLRKSEVYTEAAEWYGKTFGNLDLESLPLPDTKEENIRFEQAAIEGIELEPLQQFCAAEGITMNVLTTAAFGYLAGVYMNDSESLFATIYNGRSDLKTSHTIAMMVKTLPIYCSWKPETSIHDYLQEVKQLILTSMQHDIYSFAELCGLNSCISSQMLFAYQGDLDGVDELFGDSYEEIPLHENATGEKLSFQLFRQPDNTLKFLAEYQANLYTQHFVDSLMKCFVHVLKEFVTQKKVCDVTVLSESLVAELDSFNETEYVYDKSQTIVSLFRTAAGKYPDHAAVALNDEVFSYARVNELSDRIAGYIHKLGLGRGHVVSILIPRCTYMVTASLGALKACCCYQPLDHTYPAERLNFMMKDAEASLLITTPELRPIVNEYEGPVLYLDEIPNLPSLTESLEDPQPADRFTLLYTSGTTGLPKGCILTHANLVAFCNWYHSYMNLTAEGNVGAYASYGFDANMMDMYSAITIGATCTVVGEDIRLDLPVLYDYLADHKVTHFFMTTQVGRQFACDYPTHPTLKHLTVGGEKLVPLVPPKSYAFYNGYGPTECTICTSSYKLTSVMDNIPIGMPIYNFKVYVVDKFGHRLPIGALGELVMTGPQVSNGYLNRPEQTDKVFVTNPFATDEEHKRMYRSGDVVRYQNDGNLEFVGRKDSQVKIRGFRIELTEVEAVIRDFPGITDATVAAFDDPNGGKFIAAYVVSDAEVDVRALNKFIAGQKPPYMVPAVTMQIDRIPLNQNMKVNKRALPEPKLEMQDVEEENRTPNVLEEELQYIIGGIIRCEKFGFNTELTYLGLTSILSIKLAAAIYKRFALSLPSKFLMHGATLLSIENEIINHWMSGDTAAGNKSADADSAVGALKAVPLSYSQQGVYYDCMKRPTEVIYNIPAMFLFDASVNPDQLESAVRTIIASHPSVMAHFEMQQQEVMEIRDNFDVTIEREKMSEDELLVYKKSFVRPFNLSKSPLFRLAIVQTESRTALLVDFHHLIFDGASMDLFTQNLKQLLEGHSIETEKFSYFDYAASEKEAEAGETYAANRDFFHQMLCRCDGASEVPADCKGKAEEGILDEVVRKLDGKALYSFCQTSQITPAGLCLAAAFYTVSRYINNKDVYISIISSGRSDLRITDTMGMFVKTLPLGIHIADQTAEEFIRQSVGLLADTVEHEVYPFSKISTDYNYSPQIMYACQLGVLNELQINHKKIEMEGLELNIAKFKLSIHIDEVDGSPAIVLQYNNAVYSSELMQSFAASMAVVLQQMMNNPKILVKKLTLLDVESKALVESFRDTGDAHTGLYHEAIDRQAELHPDRMALIATDASFTYASLKAHANRIANALIERGVKRGDRVALLLPRTSRVILSMFGVMKSGAAYIPCDPDYPVERINHILTDSEAAYVITTANRVAEFPEGKAVDVEDLLACTDEKTPQSGVTPSDLVYLIYTSGSTGKPKGVMLTHAGITNYLTDHPRNVHVHALVSDAHAFLSVTTVSFDMSLKEIGTALYNGLTLIFADEQQANNPILLAELFRKTGADAFNATPSRMMQYIELDEFREALANCRVIMCGGEKYPDQLLIRLRSITSAKIFNTYGPTEITVSSNGKNLTESDIVTIGKPLLNYQEFVVDSDGNELPPLVTGELYIGGVGVARGYQHLDKMTAERFVDYKGGRVYKSGDYARWTSDGEVVILGRSDMQVKLRGLRIELGEVESCIHKYPGIRSAVVLIRKINKVEHLCAYFTAEMPVDVEKLKDSLKVTLAQYMVPTAYLQLETIPLTPNGKTDVKALPEPQLVTATASEAPANETERIFCDIFARILQLDKVGATDSFFEMGGTSLSVASIIIEADKAGFTVAYGNVFANPTPRGLANLFRTDEDIKKDEKDSEITDFDYAALQPVLDANNLDSLRNGESQPIGNVLLTGGTGFLGVHILHTLITQETGKIYCLLRPKGGLSAEERLKTVLFYYFDNSYEELIGKRIFIVGGDVTRPETFVSLESLPINTVYNCAANVKHFAAGDEIESVNVGGVKTLIDFCKKTGARLIQVSTMSVGGLIEADHPKFNGGLSEKDFYFGQELTNKYIRSKFLAERLILQSVRDNSIQAKIMRVGNLSARSTDGEFQINFLTNTFMGRLKSFRIVGKCAYEMLDNPLEFSPIDSVARAIVALSTTPKECCMFHPYNHHFVLLGDVLKLMSDMGFPVESVEMNKYKEALAEAEADPEKAKILSSMIAYQNMGGEKEVYPTRKNNTYTMQVLYRLGYHWPITSWDYVNRLLNFMRGMAFFDDNY